MGNVKTIAAISAVGGFVAGYFAKWGLDYLKARKTNAANDEPQDEEEAAE